MKNYKPKTTGLSMKAIVTSTKTSHCDLTVCYQAGGQRHDSSRCSLPDGLYLVSLASLLLEPSAAETNLILTAPAPEIKTRSKNIKCFHYFAALSFSKMKDNSIVFGYVFI